MLEKTQTELNNNRIDLAQAKDAIKVSMMKFSKDGDIEKLCEQRSSKLRGVWSKITQKTPKKVHLLAELLELSGLNLEALGALKLPESLKKVLEDRETTAEKTVRYRQK